MNKRNVVIASQFPNERIKKIALSLNYSKNYSLTLLCCEDGQKESTYNSQFNKIVFVTPIDKIFNFLKKNNIHYKMPLLVRKYLYKLRDFIFQTSLKRKLIELEKDNELIYAFDLSIRNFFPYYIIKNTKLKTIYDSYDLTSIYPYDILLDNLGSKTKIQKEYDLEKFCLENCDGLILKNSKILSVIQNKGYVLHSKFLHFADYCEPNNFQKIELTRQPNYKKINIAYAGQIKSNNEEQSYRSSELHKVIENIRNHKLLFHIYSHDFTFAKSKKLHKVYFKLEKKGFLKVKGFLPTKALLREISKFDFGIVALFSINYFKTLDKTYVEHTYGNRVSTMLEAGLPLLATEEFKEYSKIIKEYKIGISIESKEIHNMSQYLEEVKYDELLNNVDKFRRNEYNLYKNSPRLDQFIQNLLTIKE